MIMRLIWLWRNSINHNWSSSSLGNRPEVNWETSPQLFSPISVFTYAAEDIMEPSHGRVFHEKFRSVYALKGVWSWLTDLFLNRLPNSQTQSLSFLWYHQISSLLKLTISWAKMEFLCMHSQSLFSKYNRKLPSVPLPRGGNTSACHVRL